MSTESAAGRSWRRQAARFHRVTLTLLAALAVVAAGLGAINAGQGPRLDSAEVNVRASIDRPGQRLLLHTNQPLAKVGPAQVVITPSAASTVTVDGATIVIKFEHTLDYDTEYSVSVAGVTGASTGVAADLDYRFTTPDVELYSLLRQGDGADGTDQPDLILRHTLSGSATNEEVFRSPRIQEYAALDDALAVVALDAADTPSLLLHPLSGETDYAIDVARALVIRDLHASDSGELFGYIVSSGADADSPDLDNALFVYDTADSSGIPREITGFDGRPLSVVTWTFVPGSTSLVVQGEDQQLYLVDPTTDGDPVPLGQHDELRGFVPGTLQLVVADPDRGALVDLATGTTTDISLPEPEVDPTFYPDKLLVLDAGSYLQLYTEVARTESGSVVNSVIYRTGQEGTTEAYGTTTGTSRITDYCLSPNGQYLAVEVVPNSSPPDRYPTVFGYGGSSIYFVELADGTASRGVNGFLPNWCR